MTQLAARCLWWIATGCGVAAIAGCASWEGGSLELGRASVSASAEAAYHPDRRDYATFREAHPGLLEPNYLPFMVHRFRRNAAVGDALVFCRWSESQMPILVHLETPDIPASLQDEFRPRDPELYREAGSAARRGGGRASRGGARRHIGEMGTRRQRVEGEERVRVLQ